VSPGPEAEAIGARLAAGEAVLLLDLPGLLSEFGPTPPPWRLLASRAVHDALHATPAPALAIVACAAVAFDPDHALRLFTVEQVGDHRRLALGPEGGAIGYRVDPARRVVELLDLTE
jgi:hypothetical protein